MDLTKVKQLQKKLKPILIPLSLLYETTVSIKETLYALKKPLKFEGLKIISIGNIVAGGTGKTPLAIELANKLYDFGKVGIITNIYPIKDNRAHIVSIDGKIFKKPPKIPDEAYLIAKKVNKATVIASKKRRTAIELMKTLGVKFVILDDALHISSVKKDVEICVFDKDEPFSNGFYLPAGMIRNSKKLLKKCTFNVCIDKNNTQKKTEIECYESKLQITGVFNNEGQKINIKNRNVFVFCGIGNPESFINTVRKLNANIVGYKFFKDHYQYTKNDLEFVKAMKSQTKADFLITTYKDFVKINNNDIFYLDIDLKTENINEIIERIVSG